MGLADTPQVVDSVPCRCEEGIEPRTVLWGGLTHPKWLTVYPAVAGGGGFEPKEHDQDSSVGCPDKSQVVEWLTVYSAVARGGG